MQYVKDYWYLTAITLILLAFLISYGYKQSGGKGKSLSAVVIVGILLPPIIGPADSRLVEAAYFVFLGAVFLVAYAKPSVAFVFKGLEGICTTLFFPRSKNWLLILGVVFIFFPLVAILFEK